MSFDATELARLKALAVARGTTEWVRAVRTALPALCAEVERLRVEDAASREQDLKEVWKFIQDDKTRSGGTFPDHLDTEKALNRIAAELTRRGEALRSINDIRNSIVGAQAVNFSEHIYPLVAALDGAGLKGLPYPADRLQPSRAEVPR